MHEKKRLKILGQEIKAARKACGLTQENLAERCGFDPTYVSLLERGLRNPPFLTLCNLADKLDLPLKKLFEKL